MIAEIDNPGKVRIDRFSILIPFLKLRESVVAAFLNVDRVASHK